MRVERPVAASRMQLGTSWWWYMPVRSGWPPHESSISPGGRHSVDCGRSCGCEHEKTEQKGRKPHPCYPTGRPFPGRARPSLRGVRWGSGDTNEEEDNMALTKEAKQKATKSYGKHETDTG